MTDQAKNTAEPARQVALGAIERQALAQQIIGSGALGRSKVYANLLQYLVNAADQGSPKEIEIAIEVLGRTSDFDVAKDSAVRVYIHQLRKKLDHYYSKFEPEWRYKLTVPKGQYTIEVLERIPGTEEIAGSDSEGDAETDPGLTHAEAEHAAARPGKSPPWLWPAILATLLAANLTYWLAGDFLFAGADDPGVAAHPTWQALFDDDMPIMVVMGDYYIFGELDEAGNVSRMIRDFDINSKQDLDNLFAAEPELGWTYYDLNLNYLPEGSALALADIIPVLRSSNKPVNVKMMSDVSTRDLQRNHVVYIGYVSALDRLSNMVFSVSDLRIGDNYDQLINKNSREVYTSNAGLPSFDEPFLDYGWFVTFPSTQKTQMVIVAGMRDGGLVHTAQAVSEASTLQALDQRLAESEQSKSSAYEAVYQVRGLDRMNFDARLEYAGFLNARGIWRRELEVGSRK